MTQTHDVLLNGAGYMLVPPPEGRGGAANYTLEVTPFKPVSLRTGVRDWLLPLDARDETRWRADSLVPELNGYGTVQGLVLGPALRSIVAFGGGATAVAVYNGGVYLAIGATLYKIAPSAGGSVNNPFVTVGAIAAGTITAMWVYNNRLWLAAASPATTVSSTDGTTITAAPGTQTASQGFGFATGNWVVSRTSATTLAGTVDGGTTWTYYQTEGAVRSVCVTGRACLIAHAAGIDELTGQWTTSGSTTTANFTLTPLVRTVAAGAAGDYAWLVDDGGAVHTWFGGTVCRLERSTITGGRLVPVAGAPRGTAIAACVAAGRLWVAVVTTQSELWSTDGARWARHYAGTGTVPQLLVGSGGITSDTDVLVLSSGAGGAVLGLLTQAVGHTAFPAASGSVTLGPWDGGKPDAAKTWTEIEIVWNVPDRASAPSGAVLVETSTNGGTTYQAAGTTTITGGTGGTITQAMNVSGETLVVRVTWTPTANGVGLRLVAVSANGWELPASPTVKRWSLRLRCSDKLIKRDGTVDARTGEQMRGALIGLASSGAAVSYQDLDYDANAVTQTVRVVAVVEATRRGDGTHFWESEVMVTLEAIS